MCTKFGAAVLVAAGMSLALAPATLGQATKGDSSDFRRVAKPTTTAHKTRAMQQGGIAGPTSNCCFANGGLGCDDPTCEAAVCAVDPFCCATAWDSICAGEAATLCPKLCASTGTCPPSANDCCVPSPDGTPGCNDPTCCEAVCAIDPFCCATAWDSICAGEAAQLCPACAPPPCDPPPANDECEFATDLGVIPIDGCATAIGTGLCAQPDCGLFVFGQGNLWLRFEITEARNLTLNYCGSVNTSAGPWGNAWLNLAVGCPCSAFTVAASFAFSCPDGNLELSWQNMAAGVYYYPILIDPANGAIGDYNITICSTAGVPVCPNPKHDCLTAGGPGCSDAECCEIVCALDPFCCATAWDGICVSEAATNCGFPPPANDNCADRIAIGEVCQFPFNTIGAVTDGPAHVECEDGFADQFVNQDIWYNYTPSCDGDVTVSLCGSALDTKLAVYDGCSCELSDANLIDCEDDTCGLQSEITFPAIAGNCYKIRVGGFGAAVGSGQLTISNSGVPCTSGCVSDVDNNGVTNVDDLLIIINGWGPCVP
jgi:hypothetical protein